MAVNDFDTFGDFTQTNRVAAGGNKRLAKPSKKRKINSITNSNRGQAAQGSAGTTLGDNSGTGINTAPVNNRKVTIVGTPGGERLGARHRNNPANQARNLLDSLRSDVNNGRISARSAARIQAGLIENLNTVAAKDRGTSSVANTASQRLDFNRADSVANRLSDSRESEADRVSRERVASNLELGRNLRAEATNQIQGRTLDQNASQFAVGQENFQADLKLQGSQADNAAAIAASEAALEFRKQDFAELESDREQLRALLGSDNLNASNTGFELITRDLKGPEPAPVLGGQPDPVERRVVQEPLRVPDAVAPEQGQPDRPEAVSPTRQERRSSFRERVASSRRLDRQAQISSLESRIANAKATRGRSGKTAAQVKAALQRQLDALLENNQTRGPARGR